MRVFAGSISAQRRNGFAEEVVGEPIGIVARNEDEAVGKLLSFVKNKRRMEDGWHSHSAAVADMTDLVWERLADLDTWDMSAAQQLPDGWSDDLADWEVGG